MKNTEVKEVHISKIAAGDTINHLGTITTVGKNDIKKGSFMGVTLFGDSYKLGKELVKKVIFKTPINQNINNL